MTLENLEYYDPESGKFWRTYLELRYSFPNMSIPEFKDLPEIGVYRLHRENADIPQGVIVEWLPSGSLDPEEGIYNQDYRVIPTEE